MVLDCARGEDHFAEGEQEGAAEEKGYAGDGEGFVDRAWGERGERVGGGAIVVAYCCRGEEVS